MDSSQLRTTFRKGGGHRLRRRSAVVFAVAALLLAGIPAAAAAQDGQPGTAAKAPYVVLMDLESVIEQAVAAGPAALAGIQADGKIDSSSPAVRQHVNRLRQQQDRALAGAQVDREARLASYAYAVNGFSAALTAAEAQRLARQPGVARVVRDELRQLHTDVSPGFLELDSPNGAWESDLDGEGVIIGVVDTGIWPEHPSFADDGTFPSPPASWMGGVVACEFGDTAHNPDDAPFDCNDKLIGARDMRTLYKLFIGPEVYNSARDYDGHGTHTASTAGGNRDVMAEIFGIARGTVSGIAPRAQVAAYSACGSQGCFGGDLAAAIDAAVADGVDVINYSIGGGPGLTGPDDIAFLFANAAGVFTATSAGNSGPGAATLGSPANDPWITAVGANTHNRTFQGSAALGNGTTVFGASVTGGTDQRPLVDAADHGNEQCLPNVMFSPPITGAIVLCARGVGARVDKSRAVFEQGGAGMVLYNQTDAQAQVTDNHWVPSVNTSFSDGQVVKAYLAGAGGDAVATIGAGVATVTQGSVMADFSSRGPTVVAESIIKPDVTAPGVNILAGASPTPNLGAPGQLFQSISGTSMSSPHVAGVFALVKQARPDWSPAMAQSAVMTTARQDVWKEDGVTPGDPFDMGAGHVRPGKNAAAANSVFNPGLVYHAGFNDYLGFLCDAAPEVFANPAATCAALAAAGIPTTAENLNYPSIGVAEVPGSIEVRRVITSVADEPQVWAATVQAPAGYQVEVTPKVVLLAPGQSATVTIEITNVTAPLGEWRFGSLTWRGGGHHVRSPIAAKGVALQAPAAVSGTGTDGDLSFDVAFGYTGEYTAAPHGPVSTAGIAGSVDQDPDQTFNPADPTGTTAHQIVVSGSAHLRLELATADLSPPDPAIDLDLYLFNSSGQEVASSTSGGTAEQIELSLPADDTYTLYVHGWQTTGLTVDYSLRSWDVPQTPGTGAFVITSAPGQAVIATTGTVDVAWAGLTPGTVYLGAVSHTGPDGLLRLTLVRVTTS
jgi:subtilisin family serine protease